MFFKFFLRSKHTFFSFRGIHLSALRGLGYGSVLKEKMVRRPSIVLESKKQALEEDVANAATSSAATKTRKPSASELPFVQRAALFGGKVRSTSRGNVEPKARSTHPKHRKVSSSELSFADRMRLFGGKHILCTFFCHM